jgi:hypothetical protein
VPGQAPCARSKVVSGWPKRYKLTHAFLWEYSYKRLKLAQLLGQLGAFLTCVRSTVVRMTSPIIPVLAATCFLSTSRTTSALLPVYRLAAGRRFIQIPLSVFH